MKSVLLNRPKAVAKDDESMTPWHFGDPLREQRKLVTDGALVDRSDRAIIKISGPDRLSWLHTLTSQHLENLGDDQGTQLLFLSPNGHIEYHVNVFNSGEQGAVWFDTELETAGELCDFLSKMKFFSDVTIDDVTQDWALLTYTGDATLAQPEVLEIPGPKFSQGELPKQPSSLYYGVTGADGGFSRRTDALGVATVDRIVPRQWVAAAVDELPVSELAGTWAYDVVRAHAKTPQKGVDTDHKTIPHEIPAWLAAAIHLDKGCYRGQETVARVHNLGKPPRQLVKLQLDGSTEHAPEPGTEIVHNGKTVGRIGTAGRHYEEGMIALALLRRNVAERPDAELEVDGSTAVVDR
ncbi:MAG TPA: folate-binding protein [Candidatus Stackebrandtia faecavium]|nr:folate-binding protein [Candidatus Stackebrandtia faecavium]